VLVSVAKAEIHERELEEANGSGDGGFLYIAGVGANLVVCPYQTDLGEEATTKELLGVIMYVTDGIAVGNGSGVQRSTVSAGTSTVALLGHDM
jgi:hypothetical protein